MDCSTCCGCTRVLWPCTWTVRVFWWTALPAVAVLEYYDPVHELRVCEFRWTAVPPVAVLVYYDHVNELCLCSSGLQYLLWLYCIRVLWPDTCTVPVFRWTAVPAVAVTVKQGTPSVDSWTVSALSSRLRGSSLQSSNSWLRNAFLSNSSVRT